jgi:hypothetical protein
MLLEIFNRRLHQRMGVPGSAIHEEVGHRRGRHHGSHGERQRRRDGDMEGEAAPKVKAGQKAVQAVVL